jgi:hypothetical protein
MPAIAAIPPRAAIEAATAAARGGALWRLLRPRRPADAVSMPLRLFVMRLSALADAPGERVAALAEPVGWRFLAREGKEHVAIEVSDRGGPAQIETSPFVAETERTLERVDDAPRLAEAAFEPRMLRIPELQVMSLWFVSRDETDELVLPLAPAPESFAARELYEARDFLRVASAAARAKLEAPQARRRGLELDS